jgi:hypothetical protein
MGFPLCLVRPRRARAVFNDFLLRAARLANNRIVKPAARDNYYSRGAASGNADDY